MAKRNMIGNKYALGNPPNSTSIKKGQHLSPATEFKKGEVSREKNPFWKGGRRKTTNGYIMINVPNHPRSYRNEVYEHIVVAEKKIGRYLNKGETVHHINRIRDDNRQENLMVFKNSSDHMKIHTLSTWSRKHNKCQRCHTEDRRHEAKGYCERCYKNLKYHKICL